jgi:large subunit ribosomal protein L6e
VNGIPLRRLNRAYLILTKTKIDLGKVKLPKVNEKLLSVKKKRVKPTKEGAEKKTKQQRKKERTARSPELIKLQKEIDNSVYSAAKKIPRMIGYLNSHFTLTNTQRPHLMKF